MKNCNLTVKKCTLESVDSILELQDKVLDEIVGDKTILRRNSREMFELCVQEPNLSLGLYDGEELVGISVMFDGAGTDEDLSHGLEQFEVSNSVNLKLVMVRRDYQGLKYQRNMAWVLEKIAVSRGYEYFIATVAPHNHYSRDNCIASGFQYDHTAVKYGGATRDVLVKKLAAGEKAQELTAKAKTLEGSKDRDVVRNCIDLETCYQTDLSLATFGDVLEYADEAGEHYFGLCLQGDEKEVLISDPEKKCQMIKPVSEEIGSLKLVGVWMCPLEAKRESDR